MSVSRRHFVLGTAGAAAGLILPSYYRRVLEFLDRTGSPLLEPQGITTRVLTAYPYEPYGDELKYGLIHGPFDTDPKPPELTLQQFADRYAADLDELLDCYGELAGLDTPVNWELEYFLDTWLYEEAPERRAYEILSGLDLGPELSGPEAVGYVHLEVSGSPGSAAWTVGTNDEISLSLLQERLNALHTGIRIEMA